MNKCTIIGISDSRQQWFAPNVKNVIQQGHVFSGGKRHYEIVKPELPTDALWIDITVPLSAVFEQYGKYEELVIFASGDPLFYGFAATVKRECPNCEMSVIPSFNSIQLLVHRMQLPYNDLVTVSLTGRPWDGLDEALIKGERLIGCLTDHHKTPHDVWKRMVEYGYTNYKMVVGEKLGNETEELVGDYNALFNYATPNSLLLIRQTERHVPFGLPDDAFDLLDGRKKMITKMPIRLCTLSALDLGQRRSFWDVGFCTGSVSIEAKLRFPHLHITSFEIREEGKNLMDTNSRRFGALGIDTVIADFLKADVDHLEKPDAVFIGGHGGRLKEMIAKIRQHLAPNGCIVFNSVSEESLQLFREGTKAVGMQCQDWCKMKIDDNNTITIVKAE